jgi:carbonic anhydrase/acetyltransferase-like protein (isoleucine patch superfamily)
MGTPAKIKRELTEEEISSNKENALKYIQEGILYKQN